MALKDHAHDSWAALYGENPAWGKAEYVCLATAARRLGEARAQQVWDHYLTVKDTFFAGHDPKLFVRFLSRFQVGTVKPVHFDQPDSFRIRAELIVKYRTAHPEATFEEAKAATLKDFLRWQDERSH